MRGRELTASERGALRALAGFACACVAAPAVAYKMTRNGVCEWAYEKYGTAMLATESGRATCAGMFAIISVNCVLAAYVAFAAAYGTREAKAREDSIKEE